MSNIIHKFYDKAYKDLFSHPKMVKDLMEGFVGEDFVKDINFDELEKVNVTFIAESYKEREEDLVVKLRFKEQEVYLYILISLQSSPDKFMALRSLTYTLLFYQDLIKQGKIKDQLPMVFPIVLYTGKEKYNSAIQIEDLIYKPYENLRKYIPKYEYFKIEVKPEDKKEYKRLAKVDNIAAGCFDLATAKSPEEFIAAGKALVALLMDRKELEHIISIWLGHLLNKENIDLRKIVEGGGDDLSTFIHVVHESIEKGIAEGMEKGRAEGMEKGLEKGKMETAKKALEKGLEINLIAEITGLAIEIIQNLKEEH